MTQPSAQQSQVDRLEQRVDRMTETLATKDDVAALRSEVKDDIATLRSETRNGIKILHDRLNGQNILIMTGFIVTIVSVIITRLLS